MGTTGAVLFEDLFEVLARDPDGKKFDKGGAGVVTVQPQP